MAAVVYLMSSTQHVEDFLCNQLDPHTISQDYIYQILLCFIYIIHLFISDTVIGFFSDPILLQLLSSAMKGHAELEH